MIILITGGTGMIGKALSRALQENGHEVRILSRKANPKQNIYAWDYRHQTIDERALQNVQGIIHLAGATVSKRWTPTYRQEMYDSRIKSLRFLGEKLQRKHAKLKFLISASGVNYYGTQTTSKIYKEDSPNGEDFLAHLCSDWEQEVDKFPVETHFRSILRTAVVLDKRGGALAKMLPSFRWGMGAILGEGNQIMPCISLEDIVKMYVYCIENQINGVYNAVGFNCTQKEFAEYLASELHRPLWMKIPAFALKILLGSMSEILLEGSAISHDKILSEGFRFQNPSLDTLSL